MKKKKEKNWDEGWAEILKNIGKQPLVINNNWSQGVSDRFQWLTGGSHCPNLLPSLKELKKIEKKHKKKKDKK